ncbi:MAG: pentapeptide repeat-containing protein [Gammaproteobacteria bacterium]|nr:pentapeptide repeat-containing protein [Gammaproteobacteria bacterium]
MSDYLSIGKSHGSLADIDGIAESDALIANETPKGMEMSGRVVQRSVWTDVSLLQANVAKCDFSYSTFVNCYFRGARFRGCNFTGCRFIGCNFRSSAIQDCDLRYTKWDRTDIPRSTVLGNLPAQPNLAQEILIQLRLNATSVGEYEDARQFLYEAEKRSREHFVAVMKCRDDYYRGKYSVSLARVAAPFRYLKSLLNKLLWGYGEQPLRLTVNGLLATLVLGLLRALGDEPIDIWEAFRLSVAAFVSAPAAGAGEAPSVWAPIQSLIGVVYIAFLAASLHRRVSTRRD